MFCFILIIGVLNDWMGLVIVVIKNSLKVNGYYFGRDFNIKLMSWLLYFLGVKKVVLIFFRLFSL